MSLFWRSGPTADAAAREERPRDSERQVSDPSSIPVCLVQSASSCAICLAPISGKTKAVLQPCLHSFHFECIDRWLRTRRYCAYCRTSQPHVRHNFTSSLDFSTKFYEEDLDDSLDLDLEDLEILDWEEELEDRATGSAYNDDEEDEEDDSNLRLLSERAARLPTLAPDTGFSTIPGSRDED